MFNLVHDVYILLEIVKLESLIVTRLFHVNKNLVILSYFNLVIVTASNYLQ